MSVDGPAFLTSGSITVTAGATLNYNGGSQRSVDIEETSDGTISYIDQSKWHM